jgi:hypothetical protein
VGMMMLEASPSLLNRLFLCSLRPHYIGRPNIFTAAEVVSRTSLLTFVEGSVMKYDGRGSVTGPGRCGVNRIMGFFRGLSIEGYHIWPLISSPFVVNGL